MPITMQDGISSENPVRLVHPKMIPYLWDDLVPIFLAHPRGLLDGFYSLDEVEQLVAADRLDLWVGLNDNQEVDCLWLCRIDQYDSFRTYRIVWTGGSGLKYFEPAMAQFELYARDVVKADSLVTLGRKGLTRKMAPLGYQVLRYEMWKPLGRRH